jgi:hypothetical protein
MPKEWDFPEDSEQVDLNRIVTELSSIPAVYAYSYMEQLKKNAPIVYERLKSYSVENNLMTWYVWEQKE